MNRRKFLKAAGALGLVGISNKAIAYHNTANDIWQEYPKTFTELENLMLKYTRPLEAHMVYLAMYPSATFTHHIIRDYKWDDHKTQSYISAIWNIFKMQAAGDIKPYIDFNYPGHMEDTLMTTSTDDTGKLTIACGYYLYNGDAV